jgi:aflatoxin B1 aldehyde reductase
MCFEKLAGGIFSGKYKTADLPSEGRYSSTNASQGKMYRDRYFKDATFSALALIEPVVQKHNLTLLETALRWCVHHSKLKVGGVSYSDGKEGNDGIIIGVSSLKQLEGNLEDLEKGPLPEEVVKVLDEAWEGCKGTSPLYWR